MIDPSDCHVSELEEFGVTVRTLNMLEEASILTVRDLIERRPDQLIDITNFGQGTLLECVQAARQHQAKYGPYVSAVEK